MLQNAVRKLQAHVEKKSKNSLFFENTFFNVNTTLVNKDRYGDMCIK